jgi:hypothetical protein
MRGGRIMEEDYINSILFYEDRTDNRYVNSMKEEE